MRRALRLGAAILVVAGMLSARPCQAESWLEFDGIDDRVTIPYDLTFPTEIFTIAAWIRLERPARRAAIIARGEDDTSFNLSWQMYVLSDGTLEVMLEDVNEDNHEYPSDDPACLVADLFVADGLWHHVAATRSGAGDLDLYVDGQHQGPVSRPRCRPLRTHRI